MTQSEFEDRLREINENCVAETAIHETLDLISTFLKDLGYTEGARIINDISLWVQP